MKTLLVTKYSYQTYFINILGSKKDSFVHLPAKNIGDIKAKKALEDRIQRHKEERERKEFLSSEKPLGDDSIGSTADFLKRVVAAKKAKEQPQNSESAEEEQMDIDEEPKYGSNYLSGVAIEHKASRFDLTGPTILTLKDKSK